MRIMILTALVLALGLTAAGCQTGTAGAASPSGSGPSAAVRELSRVPGAYHASGTGHVDGFKPGPWDRAGQAVRGAAERTEQGVKDTGKAMQKAAKDTGKAAERAAKDTGKTVRRAAEDTGKAARQAAKDTGKAIKKATDTTR